MALNLLCAQEVPRRGEDALYPSPLCNKQGKSLLGGQSCPTAVHVGLHSLWATEDNQRIPPGWRAQHCLGQCGVPVGGGGWGHPTTGAGHAACWAARPSCTSPQQQPHCSLGIDAGCSLQVLFAQGAATVSCRASSFVPTPQPGPALAAVLLRVPPCPSMSIGGGGGNEPEGDAGSSCSWGSPSLVCLHRQCPMEHTGTGCGVPLVRSPTAPQHHAPIRPLALRSNIIFIGETGRG